jgi:nucleoside-diphosphate-sugar epimerase
MRILITGADGFVGGYLVSRLLEDKHKLFLIGNKNKRLKERFGSIPVCLSFINLPHTELTQKITEFSPEVVFHLAGYTTASDSYTDLKFLFSANILFLGKILDALKDVNLKCFIYTGSSTEFCKEKDILNPAYLYSATKTAGRSILNYYSDVYNFKSIFVTPYNVYGGITSQKKIIDILYNSLDSEFPVDITLGRQVLDFIYISDLIDLFCKILDNVDMIPDKTNFHAGTGKGTSIRKIAKLFEKATGKRANIRWGGIPYRKKDIMHSVADVRKQRELLNWQPEIELKEGIKMYLDTIEGKKSVK